MAYCTPEKVIPYIGFPVSFSANEWLNLIESASMMVDGYSRRPFGDNTVYSVVDETHYNCGTELQLRNIGVIGIDSIKYYYEDILGWIKLTLPTTAYISDANGLILLKNVLALKNPNILKVSYKYLSYNNNIPRYVVTASAMLCASIILSQPKNAVNDDNLKDIMDRFGGDLEVVKSVGIQGVSVSFDTPSVNQTLGEIFKLMREQSKALKDNAVEIIKNNAFKPRFD